MVRAERRSENTAMGILAPANDEKPMNQIICGSAGLIVSMQPGKHQKVSPRVAQNNLQIG